jgi:dienelactone hydrolase
MNWLAKQPNIASDRFGVIGASRGGELAILAASLFPRIEAVVGYTPSGVIWEGIGSGENPAWAYQGKPFLYLKFMEDEDSQRRFKEAQENNTPYLDAPSFLYSLKMQADQVAAATIPVEKSKAAFLLIGNPGDGVWPSDMLSQISIDRLQAHLVLDKTRP